ncbi:hypothetical protein B566_EDAN016665, partial [Ephemera danica]
MENQIAIWDTRNFEKPIVTLSQAKPISKLLWCPTRHNLLGSLCKDSAALCLYDVQHATVGAEEETAAIERSVSPGPSDVALASFSWHPVHENRMLAVTQSGRIHDYTVAERVTLNFSAALRLVRSVGRRSLKMLDQKNEVHNRLEDISSKMKNRALSDYGLKADLQENGELAEDTVLRKLWHWLGNHRIISEDGSSAAENRHPGVRSVLKLDSGQSNGACARSEAVSDERKEALELCGWPPQGSKEELSQFVNQLEANGDATRAAALAVFHLRIRVAIEILNRGAARGFSDDKNSIWRELCQPTRTHLTDPYLRAMFAFLTAEKDNYEGVLNPIQNDGAMAVEDRVAFSCIFLSDSRLSEYIEKLTSQLTEDGDLAGVLLTGTSREGLDVLQKYLDTSGDIQSVCMLTMRTFSQELVQEPITQDWLD